MPLIGSGASARDSLDCMRDMHNAAVQFAAQHATTHLSRINVCVHHSQPELYQQFVELLKQPTDSSANAVAVSSRQEANCLNLLSNSEAALAKTRIALTRLVERDLTTQTLRNEFFQQLDASNKATCNMPIDVSCYVQHLLPSLL